ncbi:MAG TPA: type II secretion system protein [Candidatus Saccharimonadales bacterium]|jgi:type II secretory pathway pseudopilin PulG
MKAPITHLGFSAVELLMLIVVLAIAVTIGYDLQQSLTATHRDQTRKVAVNAVHANLQEIVRAKAGGYPRTLKADVLGAIDERLLRDPKGNLLDEAASDYNYEPTGCNGGDVCSGYVLTARLERESDYVKASF